MNKFVCFITLILCYSQTSAGVEPFVINVLPAANSMNSEKNTLIEVFFNTKIDESSISDTTFMVFGRWSGPMTGTAVINSSGTSITFTPSSNFFNGEIVTVALSKGIKSATGENILFGFTWNFWIKTEPGILDLVRTGTINVREPGEGWIQTYGTYAGDLNRDGWSDFLVPNERSNDIRVFMNDGFGGYNDFTKFQIVGGSRPSTNEGFDYNLDGLIDVAVGNSTNNIVTVFTGDGTGGFSNIVNYIVGSGVRGLSILDANGDGFADIFSANRDANNVSLLINDGNGSFNPAINFEAGGDGETACASADVNADGIMDVFVGAINSDKVILLLGDGNGGFIFSDETTVGNAPWMIAAGDVNGDGVPDVVSANASDANFSVVFCDDQGNLSTTVNYPAGSFPIAIDLGDIDGDGDLDVVTSNFDTADFTMYENDGTGVFINRRDFPANSAGSCTVLHDRDNDGDMDMTGIDEVDDLLILFVNDGAVNVIEQGTNPNEFYLAQNFPNPFNPATTISFTIVESGFSSLKVYDALGNEITTLVNEEKLPGTYEVEFNSESVVGNISSGIYFYQLRTGSFVETKMMVLLK